MFKKSFLSEILSMQIIDLSQFLNNPPPLVLFFIDSACFSIVSWEINYFWKMLFKGENDANNTRFEMFIKNCYVTSTSTNYKKNNIRSKLVFFHSFILCSARKDRTRAGKSQLRTLIILSSVKSTPQTGHSFSSSFMRQMVQALCPQEARTASW